MAKPNGLIIPVNLFDGEHFPGCARELQMLDCRNFNRVGEGIKKTQMYIELQGVLQDWVYDVAAVVNNAPGWDKTWLTGDWLDRPLRHMQPKKKTKIRKPNLWAR